MTCRDKTKSPFAGMEEAFDPFYQTDVKVVRKNGQKQTITVCLFDDAEGDVLNDTVGLDTERKDLKLVVRRRDWEFVKKMERGDTIEIPTIPKKGTYKVETVETDFAMGMVITARQF